MESDVLHINALVVEVVSIVIAVMLGIISFFMSRLIKQIDRLNETMIKMDKDISKEISTLSAQNEENARKIKDLDPLFDRMRIVESDVAVMKSMRHLEVQ